jgi:branched-subunit amino acid transport protein
MVGLISNDVSIWLTMLVVGVFTYATRLSFILIFGQREIPARLRQALRFVPPAVLTAIIFPELLIRDGEIDLSLGNEWLLAGITAVIVAWFSKNVVATIFAGMVALILFEIAGF